MESGDLQEIWESEENVDIIINSRGLVLAFVGIAKSVMRVISISVEGFCAGEETNEPRHVRSITIISRCCESDNHLFIVC